MFLKPPSNETKKCGRCKKTLDVTAFEKHLVKAIEVLYAKCKTCRPKHAASNNTSVNRAANKKRFKQSDAGKAAIKRFNQSDAGKARNKRSKQSDAGKARLDRENELKKKRRACDPAYALQQAIICASSQLVSGERITSPTFLERTSFESEKQFRDHVEAAAERLGFTMADHGDEWEVEHAIPQECYDFSDRDDVKRCWSMANVRAMTPGDNYAKGVTILDELCLEVGSAFFPLAWKGVLLTHDEKEAFYASAKAEWVPPDEKASDDDHECDDECDESDDELDDDESDDDESDDE